MSERATHTPGPWKIRENLNGTLGIDAHEPDGDPCQPCRINGNAVDEPYASVTWANARLIATAPDLLEACRGLMTNLKGSMDFAKDTIAKATEEGTR